MFKFIIIILFTIYALMGFIALLDFIILLIIGDRRKPNHSKLIEKYKYTN